MAAARAILLLHQLGYDVENVVHVGCAIQYGT